MFLLFVFLFFIPVTPIAGAFDLKLKLTYLATHVLLTTMSFFFDMIYERNIEEVKRSKEEADRANIIKDDFISKISHQLRTPLYNIVTLEKMIEDQKPDKKHKELFDTLTASTNNLVDVVNNIAHLPGIETGYKKRKNIKFDLFSSLENIFESYPSEAKKNIDINVNEFVNFDKEVIGNPVLVKQLCLNILENIISDKHSRKLQLNITVKNQKETSRKILLEFIFELNRAITSASASENKSSHLKSDKKEIDLSITEKLLKSIGKELRYEELKGKSRFIFELDFEKAVYKETPEVRKEKVNLNESNILIVEDNKINQQIMRLSLLKLVKSVDVAEDGKEALDKFGSNRYDIILMDIQMPVMNGIIATKKIREIEESTNTHTPIIAITANAMLGDKETCLSAGTDDYLSKPYQMEDLLEKMKNFLS